MTYVYRIFVELVNADSDVMHFSHEKLYEGAIFPGNKTGSLAFGSAKAFPSPSPL